jgi:hypothetical protein
MEAKHERPLVNQFLKDFDAFARTRGVYPYAWVDVDSVARYRKSGFDFFLSANGKIVFVEAKVSKNKEIAEGGSSTVARLLSDYQRFTESMIRLAGTKYYRLVYYLHFKTWVLYDYRELVATGDYVKEILWSDLSDEGI